MYLDIQPKTVFQSFDSISEFLAYGKDTPSEIIEQRRGSRGTKNLVRDFYEEDSYEAFLNTALKGFPKARTYGEPLRVTLNDIFAPHLIKKRPRYEIVGDVIDLPRHLSGLPDDFLFKYEPREGPTELGRSKHVLRILVNLTVTNRHDTENIIRRGATIAALVDLLEAANRRVEVMGVFGVCSAYVSTPSSYFIQNVIIFKEAGQQLDLDLLYFALAHPDLLRRGGFAVWETYPEDMRKMVGIPGHYGYPAAPFERIDSDIYIPHSVSPTDFKSTESASKWLKEQLKLQGAIDEMD